MFNLNEEEDTHCITKSAQQRTGGNDQESLWNQASRMSQMSWQMKVIAFITDFSVVDKIINRLKLCFAAERPPPL